MTCIAPLSRRPAVLPAATPSIRSIARHIFTTTGSPVCRWPAARPIALPTTTSAFRSPHTHHHILIPHRSGSSSSSTRWKSRQSTDAYAKEARVAGLKSRAAFKLLEIDGKHKLFRRGDTVVDLGFAPGSWSQVAVNRAGPTGRVIGIDVIPAPPPRGANALQGNFLSEETRERVREFVRKEGRGRVKGGGYHATVEEEDEEEPSGILERTQQEDDQERLHSHGEGAAAAGIRVSMPADERASAEAHADEHPTPTATPPDTRTRDRQAGRVVDVVLSDMSAPWPLVTSTWVKSVNNPYLRMMNTSGMAFRDHAGSMDLCLAALDFCYETLATGGHFLTKFYTGAEDGLLEKRLRRLFEKVHRIKPDASRRESKEAYFVALHRRPGVTKEEVFGGL